MICQYLGHFCLLLSVVAMPDNVRNRNAESISRMIPPIITEGPNYVEYFRPNNHQTSLRCSATGTELIEYNWQKNGETLIPGNHTQIKEGTLDIVNPTRDMEGSYQCFACNKAGCAASNITSFRAAELNTIEERSRLEYSVSRFDPIVFRCNHSFTSIPPATIIWESSTDGEKDFSEVNLDDRITQADDGSLVFAFVRSSDAAFYKCRTYNNILRKSIGGRIWHKLKIDASSDEERKLEEAPVLLFNSSGKVIVEGEELALSCLFGSWPIPKIEWTTPSENLIANASSRYVISNASAKDAGLYTCTARKESVYSIKVNISVKVDAIPTFVMPPTNQDILIGQDARFSCQGQGRPTPLVTWYANGISLEKTKEFLNHSIHSNGTTSFLLLKDVHRSATVTCNISNLHGYKLHTALMTLVLKNQIEEVITSSQNQNLQVETITTGSTFGTNTKLSTSQYHLFSTVFSRLSHLATGGSLDQNSSQTAVSMPTGSSLISDAKFSTPTIVGMTVGVVCLLVIIITITFICKRQRRQRRESLTVQNRQPHRDGLFVMNERVYDSDDSGFDDVKEYNERRNLRHP